MGRYTEAQAKSAKKYLSQFENITVRCLPGRRDLYKEYAEKNNVSLNKLILDYLDSLLE